ncbi:DUF6461 domain-containing protein [Streptomyces sp. NPDC052023]|uniref:DUF6461 domain-containing protein n=1 Tax=Streptomyces sp. NPDC052023 TaxID=3365681 RepID=UPI0037D24AA6
MTKTGADYAWFEDDFPDIAEAYCFTLVLGLSPAEVVSRLEGRPEAPIAPPPRSCPVNAVWMMAR